MEQNKTSKKPLNIVIIGAGNLAWHLSLVLKNAGHNMVQIYNRSAANAQHLAETIGASYTTHLVEIYTKADVYLFAVKESAISELIKNQVFTDKFLVHCSGSLSIDVFSKTTANSGVMYPLQTFSKNKKVEFGCIPFFVEATNLESEAKLTELVKSLSSNVQNLDSNKRAKLHLAAVFASNFSNHMYSIAAEILEKEKLSFDLVKALIKETNEKAMNMPPKQAQTGPAIRKDYQTIETHLALLQKDKQLQDIYRLLSEHIAGKN
jgi:predicted short-subunit dehydrogenase-like oxidoreductase (DUF2520 family)